MRLKGVTRVCVWHVEFEVSREMRERESRETHARVCASHQKQFIRLYAWRLQWWLNQIRGRVETGDDDDYDCEDDDDDNCVVVSSLATRISQFLFCVQ